jgi:hypothetical protein
LRLSRCGRGAPRRTRSVLVARQRIPEVRRAGGDPASARYAQAAGGVVGQAGRSRAEARLSVASCSRCGKTERECPARGMAGRGREGERGGELPGVSSDRSTGIPQRWFPSGSDILIAPGRCVVEPLKGERRFLRRFCIVPIKLASVAARSARAAQYPQLGREALHFDAGGRGDALFSAIPEQRPCLTAPR